jgi:hypothetical protein
MYGKELFVDKHNNLYKVDHDDIIYFCSNAGKVRNISQLQKNGKTEASYPVKESYSELFAQSVWKEERPDLDNNVAHTDASQISSKMTFQKVMELIGGDWGTVAFLDDASQKYIQIAMTYDGDYRFAIYNKDDVVFDPELNSIKPIDGARPLIDAYETPYSEDEEDNPEETMMILEKQMKEILEMAMMVADSRSATGLFLEDNANDEVCAQSKP